MLEWMNKYILFVMAPLQDINIHNTVNSFSAGHTSVQMIS